MMHLLLKSSLCICRICRINSNADICVVTLAVIAMKSKTAAKTNFFTKKERPKKAPLFVLKNVFAAVFLK